MGTPTETFVVAAAQQTYAVGGGTITDNELVLALAANKNYAARLSLRATSDVGSNTNAAVLFTVPAGCTIEGVQKQYSQSGTPGGFFAGVATSPIGTCVINAGETNRIEIVLSIINGANAGNLQLKGSASGVSWFREIGSYLWIAHL